MKYPVFICDDDQMQVNDIVKMIGKAEEILSDEHAIEFDVAFTTTFADAKKFLKDNIYTGGVYLLDIELGKEIGQNNGFDLAELIKNQDKRAQIIFITTHADLSLISFERRLGPVDYIVKPRNKEDYDRFKQRLVATLEISISNIENFDYTEKLTFHYKVGRQVRNIDIDDIIYISTTKTPHKLIMVNVRGEKATLRLTDHQTGAKLSCTIDAGRGVKVWLGLNGELLDSYQGGESCCTVEA